MKPEDEKQVHDYVMWEGAKAGVVGGVLSTAASFYAQKTFPFYRGIKFPFKALLVVASITGSFFTVADISITKAERNLAERKLIERGGILPQQPPETPKSLKHWVLDNKYHIVGFGWLAVAGGTLLYQWKRGDVTRSQKIINARLSSQGILFLFMSSSGIGRSCSTCSINKYRTSQTKD